MPVTTGPAPAARPAVISPIIAGLGLAQIGAWGTLYYSFPLIAGPMAAELGISRPQAYGGITLALVTAALAATPVGAAIDRGHGRTVLAAGSGLGALVLVGWGHVTGLTGLYLLCIALGLAQAMTLYEAGFAVVARHYGAEARSAITALSLWGGFASTVFVPLIQALIDACGWRDTLILLGGVPLAALAMHWVVLAPPSATPAAAVTVTRPGLPGAGARPVIARMVRRPVFWGLLIAFTAYYGMFSALTFHLYPLLLERGFSTAAVVTAIALVGPAQVAGRIAVWLLAERRSIRTIGCATMLGLPIALGLLLALPPGFPALVLFALLYGATNGVMTIVRGLAVPEMLTRQAYGTVNGVIALPATFAKAAAPLAAAALWASAGSYQALLAVALAGFLAAAAGFWFAALQDQPDG